MDGVTILNQDTINSLPDWSLAALVVLIVGAFLAFVIFNIVSDTRIITAFGIMSVLFALSAVMIIVVTPINETATYEVIIDDNVSFTELYEHYEIIEQRGEIYILKDREVQE